MRGRETKTGRGGWFAACDALCAATLAGVTVWLTARWGSIPGEIPMHFDLTGTPDRVGAKWELVFLPALAWAVFLLVSVVERYPKMWNTPIAVTEENRERVHAALRRALSSLKLLAVMLFLSLTVFIALGHGLPGWLLPCGLAAIVADVGFWMWRAVRKK